MSVTITSPAAGSTLKGMVTVTAAYSGSGFDIATVTLAGKQLAQDGSLPVSFQVDTSRVPDGPTTLTVAVRRRGAGGGKSWQKASITVTVKNAVVAPTKPSIPTGLVVTSGDRQATLHWDANPAGEAVDAYQVYRNDQVLDLNVAGTNYVAGGLVNGTAYTFRVSAHNPAGYGNWTAAAGVVPAGSLAHNVARSAPTAVVT